MISLRTKDDVTFAASSRLLSQARTPREMLALSEEQIRTLIYPAGFYRTKAHSIKEVSRILAERYESTVPATVDELTALPGVGRKTANLVLGLGFAIPAICVDTHVHRIANRCGWVTTRTPNETEDHLAETLPREYWIEINELLVGYGRQICTPTSPRCSSCVIARQCGQNGVSRSR